MKALTEQQVKNINDFENYKTTLKTKYYEMEKSMKLLASVLEEPSKKADSLITIAQFCQHSLEDFGFVRILIDEQNVLVIKELDNEETPLDDNEKKNKVIRILLSKLSSFAFYAGMLSAFVKEKDDTLQTENHMLKSHIEKVIEVILEQ